MFHVLLVLPLLILAVMAFSVLLFGILALIVSAMGGASAALLIKGKTAKRLLVIGFSILTFGGIICILPFIAMYMQIPELSLTILTIAAFLCIGILAVVGIKSSAIIQNKLGKTVLTVIFYIILVAAASIAVFIPIVRYFFASMQN